MTFASPLDDGSGAVLRAIVGEARAASLRRQVVDSGRERNALLSEIARLRQLLDVTQRELADTRRLLDEVRAQRSALGLDTLIQSVGAALVRANQELDGLVVGRSHLEVRTAIVADGGTLKAMFGADALLRPEALSTVAFDLTPVPPAPGTVDAGFALRSAALALQAALDLVSDGPGANAASLVQAGLGQALQAPVLDAQQLSAGVRAMSDLGRSLPDLQARIRAVTVGHAAALTAADANASRLLATELQALANDVERGARRGRP
jgi:hypothetical protein